jgi:hypothetical protein
VRFALGDPVRIEMEKWGDRPHWHIPGRWLGTDDRGDWIGIPAGTPMSRPGADVVSQNDQVGLVPSFDLPDEDRWWVGTFHAQPSPRVLMYVDIATPPVWDGATLRTVDLDLDVIRLIDGSLDVEDEDEFAEHRIELGYPDDVVQGAMRSCERVQRAMSAAMPPFDGSHARWLTVLTELTARR